MKGIVVFSGGSAANNIVDVFKTIADRKQCSLTYVIPISDNGGSSSELIRVFGGPGIGDLRSRLVRLIPEDSTHHDPEKAAIRVFFNHRLPVDRDAARHEWLDIVEARHPLWNDISSEKKELIRSFLNLLNLEIVKRARPSSVFNFSAASVGNLFLTGARLFSGSLESAIYLLSTICHIPRNTIILPAINTSFTHHISATLQNGITIVGQNAISHPSAPTALRESTPGTSTPADPSSSTIPSSLLEPTDTDDDTDTTTHDLIEDANPPGSLPSLRRAALTFSKAHEADLPARISRIWYISPYGHEIRPPANPKVPAAVASAQAVIYSIGSLYTSLAPSLILKGVGDAIRAQGVRYKILILNSSVDRETGPRAKAYGATDFVDAIVRACVGNVEADEGVRLKESYRKYVTHIVHLDGRGAPVVDRKELMELGIETVRVYGRMGDGMLRYDERGLIGALEGIIGGAAKGEKGVGSRRNTIEG